MACGLQFYVRDECTMLHINQQENVSTLKMVKGFPSTLDLKPSNPLAVQCLVPAVLMFPELHMNVLRTL